jgi:hypothetical protein
MTTFFQRHPADEVTATAAGGTQRDHDSTWRPIQVLLALVTYAVGAWAYIHIVRRLVRWLFP